MSDNHNNNACDNNLVACPPIDPDFLAGTFTPFATQITISENLELPCTKPDIGQINAVIIDPITGVRIERVQAIATPTVVTTGGMVLTGRKLCVEGVICQKIDYVADCDSQPVHAVHFEVPFSAFIVVPAVVAVPNGMGGFINVDPLTLGTGRILVDGRVECCVARKTGPRTIFKNVVLFLSANFI